ncbi:GNAT family N-acetyltransferase [Brevibacterium aurantiacum]|uniref:GNAT family N-acetyltransferase n=2 Tax=Brevibacterium aurantiacum TaxID=273384 RepID=UPI000DE5B68D|nr:GNAT family N-acetyltransferase [Brevibacterium aurantiacum]
MNCMTVNLEVVAHHDLDQPDLARLRGLFDSEYLAEHGQWDPARPYGYSPADFHVIARSGNDVVGHVGFQKRVISVGKNDVLVAGTGGVLVSNTARGAGLGLQLMDRAQESMRNDAAVSFGYLGCRPAVVPFYLSAGWTRIQATERHTARLDPSQMVESDSSPILICPAARTVTDWPEGDIDLHGGPW